MSRNDEAPSQPAHCMRRRLLMITFAPRWVGSVAERLGLFLLL